MKQVNILLVSALAMAITSPALAGKKYRGNWGGDRLTSLEIRSEKPLIVRYCFIQDCNLHEPSGTVNNMTIKFPPQDDGFPGATLKFKKSGDEYNGTYKRKGSAEVFRATLK